jgi:hypothetical protein
MANTVHGWLILKMIWLIYEVDTVEFGRGKTSGKVNKPVGLERGLYIYICAM